MALDWRDMMAVAVSDLESVCLWRGGGASPTLSCAGPQADITGRIAKVEVPTFGPGSRSQ